LFQQWRTLFSLAPCFCKNSIQSVFSLISAISNGVTPSIFAVLISSPLLLKYSNARTWLRLAAINAAVSFLTIRVREKKICKKLFGKINWTFFVKSHNINENIFEIRENFQKKNQRFSKILSVKSFEKSVKSEMYQIVWRIYLKT